MTTLARTLVLGTAYGYEVPHVWVFVESLRRHYAGEVVLLVSGRAPSALYRYLAARGVMPVVFDCAAWMVPHVQFTRYVRYGELLRLAGRYDRVLLTDVGDVLFQGHPFAGAPDGELLCFMEAAGRSIAACRSNSNWILSLYGPETLARVGGCDISCSGTTIGTHAAVLGYIDRMLGQVRPDQFLRLVGQRGHDQGVHNVLLHTGALPHARAVSNGVHVFTVGFVPDADVALAGDHILAAATGVCCPIVHQYNYKPVLLGHVSARYPLPG